MTDARTILVGGGGFSRELIFWIMETAAAGRIAPLGGYLDDAGDTLAPFDYPEAPWLGGIIDYAPQPSDAFVLATGMPRTKRRVQRTLADKGAQFATLIHPTSRVVRTARIEEGAIFCPGAAAGADSRIGRFVTFNAVCGAGHDAMVGAFTTVSSAVDITGGVQVGEDVMIGSGATLLPGVRVGDGATIGAGSVVYRSVPAGATVFAPPAKHLRKSSATKFGGERS